MFTYEILYHSLCLQLLNTLRTAAQSSSSISAIITPRAPRLYLPNRRDGCPPCTWLAVHGARTRSSALHYYLDIVDIEYCHSNASNSVLAFHHDNKSALDLPNLANNHISVQQGFPVSINGVQDVRTRFQINLMYDIGSGN